MTVNEAKKLVEEKYPNLMAASAVPYKGKYVFSMLNRKTKKMVFNSGLPTVDEKTGEISSMSVIHDDFDGYDEAAKDIVYFSKEGMDLANFRLR